MISFNTVIDLSLGGGGQVEGEPTPATPSTQKGGWKREEI